MDSNTITMLENIAFAMTNVAEGFALPCYVVGAACMFSALTMMASQREGSFGKGIMLMFIAGIFAGFPTFTQDLGDTLFTVAKPITAEKILSDDPDNALSDSEAVQKAAVMAIFTIFRVVGMVAVYKGCNRLKFHSMSSSGDPRLISEAMTLLLMGTCVIFAKEFIIVIANTVGGDFQTNVLKFISYNISNTINQIFV